MVNAKKKHRSGCKCFICRSERRHEDYQTTRTKAVVFDPDPLDYVLGPRDSLEQVITLRELEDYVDYIAHQMWDILGKCKPDNPYYWPLHQIYENVELSLDMDGIEGWIRDSFEWDVETFVSWLDESLAAMHLLLRAGKGAPSPLVCKKPILDYLRESNRPRHLTEILGMLAEKEDIYLDRGRLSAFLSTMKAQGLVRYAMCPVSCSSAYIERGYWLATAEEPKQLTLAF
jgi:hypothetical protein